MSKPTHAPSYHFWGPPRAAAEQGSMAGVYAAIKQKEVSQEQNQEDRRVFVAEMDNHHRPLGPMHGVIHAAYGVHLAADRHGLRIHMAMREALGADTTMDGLYGVFNDALEAALDAKLSVSPLLCVFSFLMGLVQVESSQKFLASIEAEKMMGSSTHTWPCARLLALALVMPIGSTVEKSVELFQRIYQMEEVQEQLPRYWARSLLDGWAYNVAPQLGDRSGRAYAKWNWLMTSSQGMFTRMAQTAPTPVELNKVKRIHNVVEFGFAFKNAARCNKEEWITGLSRLMHPRYMDYVPIRLLVRYKSLQDLMDLLWIVQRFKGVQWATYDLLTLLVDIPIEKDLVDKVFEYTEKGQSPVSLFEEWFDKTRPAFMTFLGPFLRLALTRENWTTEDGRPVFHEIVMNKPPDDIDSIYNRRYDVNLRAKVYQHLAEFRQEAMRRGMPLYGDFVMDAVAEAEVAFQTLTTKELAPAHTVFIESMSDMGFPRELMAEVGSYLFDLPGEERKEGHSEMGKQFIKAATTMDAARRVREEADAAIAAADRRQRAKRKEMVSEHDEENMKRVKLEQVVEAAAAARIKRSAGDADLPDLSGLRIGPISPPPSSARASRMNMTVEEDIKRTRMADAAAARLSRYRPVPAAVAEERKEEGEEVERIKRSKKTNARMRYY